MAAASRGLGRAVAETLAAERANLASGGAKDIFISKFDSDLKTLLASTLFDGIANDQISRSLRIDNNADINIRDQQGNTLLHIAAGRGNIEKIREILKYGLPIETTNDARQTPLLSAAMKYRNDAIINCLLDSGAKIATADSAGRGVLHVTNNSNIKILLHRGADVNWQDKDGNTPLHNICLAISRTKVKSKLSIMEESVENTLTVFRYRSFSTGNENDAATMK